MRGCIAAMKIKVLKFGGSSLASGAGFLRVKHIVDSEDARCFIVVSAPGKRYKSDVKVTDLLLASKEDATAFERAADRFKAIALELAAVGGVGGATAADAVKAALEEICAGLSADPTEAYLASRGEYLSAVMMAALLARPFVDAAEIIAFSEDGVPDDTRTVATARHILSSHKTAVIPGFYGSDTNGNIHTFSRGGSDITGSLVAAAVQADIYENWTDVSGVYDRDPQNCPDARRYHYISYEDMRRLAGAGAAVLHPAALDPVQQAGIPIRIRNSFRPSDEGTLISDGNSEEFFK